MEKKKEEWNPNNLLTEDKINKTIANFAHFTFKISNSNALSGGLIAEKLDLDGYVCMSSVMDGTEYDLMNNPSAQAKIYKRINAVIEGAEEVLFNNINKNEVLYIKKQLSNIAPNQSTNLKVVNKRLKQVIIQDINRNGQIENKELIILRSSGFAKLLAKSLKKEQETDSEFIQEKKNLFKEHQKDITRSLLRNIDEKSFIPAMETILNRLDDRYLKYLDDFFCS